MKMINNNKIIDKVYKKYKNITNMTYTELLLWSKKPLSNKASLNRSPIKRNLILLKKPKNEWNITDIKNSNKTISYLSRAKQIPRSNLTFNGYTKNEIAMKNWAYDIKK